MNAEQLTKMVVEQFRGVIAEMELQEYLKFEVGEILEETPSESVTIEACLMFDSGDAQKEHYLNLGWKKNTGAGLLINEDGDIQEITISNVFRFLYLDLAINTQAGKL